MEVVDRGPDAELDALLRDVPARDLPAALRGRARRPLSRTLVRWDVDDPAFPPPGPLPPCVLLSGTAVDELAATERCVRELAGRVAALTRARVSLVTAGAPSAAGAAAVRTLGIRLRDVLHDPPRHVGHHAKLRPVHSRDAARGPDAPFAPTGWADGLSHPATRAPG